MRGINYMTPTQSSRYKSNTRSQQVKSEKRKGQTHQQNLSIGSQQRSFVYKEKSGIKIIL